MLIPVNYYALLHYFLDLANIIIIIIGELNFNDKVFYCSPNAPQNQTDTCCYLINAS